MSKAKTTNPLVGPLTPEEDARQKKYGKRFRKLLAKSVTQFVEATENHAILLSGGVDSATVLVEMIEAGARPDCITYSIGGHISSDAKKARQLAEYYDLPFHVVQMPDDPDEVARGIAEMVEGYPDIDVTRRPNIEVLYLFQRLFEFAHSIGAKSVFSGIGDINIHMNGRRQEVDARTRGIPKEEVAMVQVWSLEDSQLLPLTQLAAGFDIDFCLPITPVAIMLPYVGLSWREMNVPRKKWVTLRAYEKEFDDIGVLIRPVPMQNGDSGAREYFDSMIADSTYADKKAGRQVSSGMQYYNSLARAQGITREPGAVGRKYNVWETWRKNVLGIEPTQKDYRPRYQITNGQAAMPELSSAPKDESNILFGDIEAELDQEPILMVDDNGLPDLRTDCFGIPFYTGEAKSNCPRAKASLCGHHRPEIPFTSEACQFFEQWAEAGPIVVTNIISACSNESVIKIYKKWAKRANDHAESMVDEARLKSPVDL